MMELKQYQRNALDTFSRWLETLQETERELEPLLEIVKQNPNAVSMLDDLRNYPKAAWKKLLEDGVIAARTDEYVDRTDGANRPIPHICFKVPTGGGKTLLAAAAVEHLPWQRGLVLWIVPSKAIYTQTKTALWDKGHPYRKMLNRAAAGHIKMLEKEDIFNAADIANYLCVMLLMLPAANRQKGREFLRLFKDSGRYPTFFPERDVVFSDLRLLNEYPDLDKTDGKLVKESLFNVFKMLRPVVVLDEAHKAYGAKSRKSNEEFAKSINRLNPRIVIELSATPNPGISNLLVDVRGTDLKKEEMIKLPIQITSFPNAEWQLTLSQAADELDRLDDAAQAFESNTGRYIRPIAVVRVERTGKKQQDGIRIHAEDVREYLTQNLNVPTTAIRVKSAEKDELGHEDLRSQFSQVRWIITKAALMEGWDCPFAYVLVILDNTQAQKAITQLVGRVMRQPHAQITGNLSLDQCYVYCNNTEVGTVVQQVKRGLEAEGLTGLEDEVMGTASSPAGSGGHEPQQRTVQRRTPFQNQKIYLPMVLHREKIGNNEEWGQLSYQAHILPYIDWAALEPPDPHASTPQPAKRQSATVDVDQTQLVFHADQHLSIEKRVHIANFARRLSDIVPNLWQAARLAAQMNQRLKAAGKTEADIYDRRSYLTHALREHLKSQVEKQAEHVFQRKLNQGEIRFDLEARAPNYRIVDSYEIPIDTTTTPLARYGEPVQLSLFEPIFEQQFDSELEKKFAYYLDEEKAIRWWHRVAARQRGQYYLQGWKPGRIYPDFVAMANDIGNVTHVLIFDTKGQHLEGNRDTEYKRKVLETLEGAFNTAGRLVIRDGPKRVGIFQLVFNEHEFGEISARLKTNT